MNFKRSILLTLVFALLAMTNLTNCSSGDKKPEPPAPKNEPKPAVETAKSTATDASRPLGAGECIGDCKNGEGMIGFSDGSKYQGQFKNEKFNGKGTLTFANGDSYTGDFKDGERNWSLQIC